MTDVKNELRRRGARWGEPGGGHGSRKGGSNGDPGPGSCPG